MHFSHELVALAAITFFSSSIASPVAPAPQPSNRVNCDNPKTGVAASCWKSLKVADYLTSWEKKNFGNCEEGQAWSTCFNIVAATLPGHDCLEINSAKCVEFDPKLHYLSPQWYYGSYNTWSINQFFSAWSNAIKAIGGGDPSIINTAAVPQDIDEFSAAKSGNVVSIDVALHNLIIQAPKSVQNDALAAALKTFKTFVTYDTSKVESANPPIATLLDIRLQQLLRHVEKDLPSFLAMASNGTFSTEHIITRQDLLKTLWPGSDVMVSIDG